MSETQAHEQRTRVKQKRSKTSVACNHCHKSHMTCDSNRPCSRCIKRNLQDTCQDAPRKRKKYLSDVPMEAIRSQSGRNTGNMSQMSIEMMQSPSDQSSGEHSSDVPIKTLSSYTDQGQSNVANGKIVQIGQGHNGHNGHNLQPSASAPPGYNDSRAKFEFPEMMKTRSKFMSSAAGLEYSTLSSIISDNFLSNTSTDHTPNTGLSPAISPHLNQVESTSPNSAINDAFLIRNNTPTYKQQQQQQHQHSQLSQYSENPYTQQQQERAQPLLQSQPPQSQRPQSLQSQSQFQQPMYPVRPMEYKDLQYDEAINQYFLGPSNDSREQFIMYPDVLAQLEILKETDPGSFFERNKKSAVSLVVGVLPEDFTSNYAYVGDTENGGMPSYIKEPEDIYEKVKKPYSYTPGYHALIAYLRKRFNKEMLVKMAETMASYRPSFIACTNSLKEHDLIFMEQCFQRTLLTYDSIIKVSGTPTIVWRRTGEIAYVGSEFCILTGYSRDELITTKKRLIVELLDDKSVLEYFQLFSKIAFGDFLGATMTECTLLAKKNNSRIKTRCLWTLKRDVFGIPMMIIGSFLPIL